MSVPDGFTLVLPDEWVTLDLDPETADVSLRKLVDGLARNDPAVAEDRNKVEALLAAIGGEATEEGALLCAARFDVDAEGRPVQATVAVSFRSVDGSSDPEALLADVEDDLIQARVVELGSGPALRVTEQTEDGFVSLGVLVPVPGVDSRVAVISLLSPSVTHEAELNEFFDALAGTFAFTWKEDEGETA
ncbi:MAG: hypothetical protein ACRDZ3_19410 [Acidimicrobiia bacterium]